MKTLYESLLEQGLIDTPTPPADSVAEVVALTGKQFAEAVLHSVEFRLYIIEGLTNRNLPPAILTRLMDHGWGKPPESISLTGKDGESLAFTLNLTRPRDDV